MISETKLTPTQEKEIELIISSVEHATDCNRKSWLDTKTRRMPYVTYRCIMAYLIHTKLRIPLSVIGRVMNKDHSTIIHNISNVMEWKQIPFMYESELSTFNQVELNYDAHTNVDVFIDSFGNKWRKEKQHEESI